MDSTAYETHALWQTLDTLRKAFELAPEAVNAEQRTKMNTIGASVAYLDQYRDEDGLLVHENHMAQLVQNVSAMAQHLQSLRTDPPNWAYLDNAVNGIPQVLQYLNANFPAPTADSATAAAKRASTMYRKTLEAAAEEFRAELEGLRGQITASEQARSRQETAFAEELATLKTRAGETEEQISTQASRLIKQIEEQRTAFDKSADERTSAYKTEAKDREDRAATQFEGIRAQATKAHADVTAKAEALLKRLEEHEATSEALVDVTSRNAIAGDYGAWSKAQATLAHRWTLGAVAVGLGTAIALIYALNHAANDSIQFTLYKTGVGVVGLIIAGYCARQAGEHRREERTAKRLHLDLAALEPFLRQVDNPMELRTEIARRVFVAQPEPTEQPTQGRGIRRGFTIDEIAALVALGRNSSQ